MNQMPGMVNLGRREVSRSQSPIMTQESEPFHDPAPPTHQSMVMQITLCHWLCLVRHASVLCSVYCIVLAIFFFIICEFVCSVKQF